MEKKSVIHYTTPSGKWNNENSKAKINNPKSCHPVPISNEPEPSPPTYCIFNFFKLGTLSAFKILYSLDLITEKLKLSFVASQIHLTKSAQNHHNLKNLT